MSTVDRMIKEKFRVTLMRFGIMKRLAIHQMLEESRRIAIKNIEKDLYKAFKNQQFKGLSGLIDDN